MTFLCSFLQDRERNLCHSRHVFLRSGISQQGLLGSPCAQTWQYVLDTLVFSIKCSRRVCPWNPKVFEDDNDIVCQVLTNSSVTWAPLDATEQNTSSFYVRAIGQLQVFRGLVRSSSFSGRCLDTQWFCPLLSSISPGAVISIAKGLPWSRCKWTLSC